MEPLQDEGRLLRRRIAPMHSQKAQRPVVVPPVQGPNEEMQGFRAVLHRIRMRPRIAAVRHGEDVRRKDSEIAMVLVLSLVNMLL